MANARFSSKSAVQKTLGVVFACVIYICCVAAAMVDSVRDPEWNFDVVGYVGAALSWSISDSEQLHRESYAQLEQAAPPKAYRSIAEGSKYRRQLNRDSEKFATQIPFYINKVAYVASVAALHEAGLNAARATLWVSIAAHAALALWILIWLVTARAGAGPTLAAGFLLAAPPLSIVASFSNPDMLVLVPLIVSAWLMLDKRRHLAGLCVALGAVWVRPDAALIVVLLAGWAWIGDRGERAIASWQAAAVVATSAAVVVTIGEVFGGASWGTVVRHTFETRLFEPHRMQETISFDGYLRALWQGLFETEPYYPSSLFLYLAISTILMWLVHRQSDRSLLDRRLTWCFAVWAYVPLHFLAFPDRGDRFFLPAYVLATFPLLALAGQDRGKSQRDETRDSGSV